MEGGDVVVSYQVRVQGGLPPHVRVGEDGGYG